jgi:hypothetical protein
MAIPKDNAAAGFGFRFIIARQQKGSRLVIPQSGSAALKEGRYVP